MENFQRSLNRQTDGFDVGEISQKELLRTLRTLPGGSLPGPKICRMNFSRHRYR